MVEIISTSAEYKIIMFFVIFLGGRNKQCCYIKIIDMESEFVIFLFKKNEQIMCFVCIFNEMLDHHAFTLDYKLVF